MVALIEKSQILLLFDKIHKPFFEISFSRYLSGGKLSFAFVLASSIASGIISIPTKNLRLTVFANFIKLIPIVPVPQQISKIKVARCCSAIPV